MYFTGRADVVEERVAVVTLVVLAAVLRVAIDAEGKLADEVRPYFGEGLVEPPGGGRKRDGAGK